MHCILQENCKKLFWMFSTQRTGIWGDSYNLTIIECMFIQNITWYTTNMYNFYISVKKKLKRKQPTNLNQITTKIFAILKICK
jgi:hypothetical protein